MRDVKDRRARMEHCFGYCEPGQEPIVFAGGRAGTIAYEPKGTRELWHSRFYIPDGETKTLSELNEINYEYESQF